MKDEIVRGELPSPDESRQITELLLKHFPESTVLRYQQGVAGQGLREAVLDMRRAFDVVARKKGGNLEETRALVHGLLDILDPDHPSAEGPFPSSLVRP